LCDAFQVPKPLSPQLQPFGKSDDDLVELTFGVGCFLLCPHLADGPRGPGGRSAPLGFVPCSSCSCSRARRHETDGACTATTYVAEPLKLIPYYCLNHSSWPLSNNIEVTYRLCRVKPGKSLTSQDRQLYIKTHMKASLEITSHKSLHNIIQRFIITNQVFIIKVNSSDSKHSGNKVLIDISNITRGHL
jgi:hypothetical protein